MLRRSCRSAQFFIIGKFSRSEGIHPWADGVQFAQFQAVKYALGEPSAVEKLATEQKNIMREILTYCLAHPDAKDTAGGILKWWFPRSGNSWRPDEVGEALEWMTAHGWLTSRTLANTAQLYGLNKERVTEIEAFLISSPPRTVANK